MQRLQSPPLNIKNQVQLGAVTVTSTRQAPVLAAPRHLQPPEAASLPYANGPQVVLRPLEPLTLLL